MTLRVVYLPGDHDYLRALYGAMALLDSPESNAVVPLPRRERQGLGELASYWNEADLVHVSWPEHLLSHPSPGSLSHVQHTIEALESLERAGVVVAWTMHNFRPHHWPAAAGSEVYARMARLARAVIHHSACGMREVMSALPYRADAVHALIPHGHYAAELAIDADRSECERKLGLHPCTLRFGVIGRPQQGKRVSVITRAFLAGAAADRQLLVCAARSSEIFPADRRLFVRSRSHWLVREEIAVQLKCCDCLVAWHGGGSHLTSGLVADSIGAGIPMLVNGDWEFWGEVLGAAALTFTDERGLEEAFMRLTPSGIANGALAAKSLRPMYDWARLAQATASLFIRAQELRNPRNRLPNRKSHD